MGARIRQVMRVREEQLRTERSGILGVRRGSRRPTFHDEAITAARCGRTEKGCQFLSRGRRVDGCPTRERKVEALLQGCLVELSQQERAPAEPRRSIRIVVGVRHPKHSSGTTHSSDVGGWKHLMDIVVVVKCQTELLEVVFALRSPRRFARLLDGGQEKSDQDGDDCDDDQQLNQRETT